MKMFAKADMSADLLEIQLAHSLLKRASLRPHVWKGPTDVPTHTHTHTRALVDGCLIPKL